MTQPTRSLLRHADFLKLWTAETISQFGTQVSLLAIPLVAVTLLDATPFEVAMLGTIEFLPFILFSLPAGAWVDRLRRRPILIVGDIGRALLLVSIPVAYALDVLTIWQLYVVGFAAGTLTVFFDVAYQSYLPSLVDRDQLIEGNSKMEVTRTLAQTAGPAISGGLIGVLTAPIAILVDSISYGISAFFVFSSGEATPDRHVDEWRGPQGCARGAPPPYVSGTISARDRGRAGTSNPSATSPSRPSSCTRSASAPVADRDRHRVRCRQRGGDRGRSRASWAAGSDSHTIAVRWRYCPGILLVALAPAQAPSLPRRRDRLTGFSASSTTSARSASGNHHAPTMQGRMNATMRFTVWGTSRSDPSCGILVTTLGCTRRSDRGDRLDLAVVRR